MPNTKIVTFVSYRNLFTNIEKSGLLLPNSYLNDEKNLDTLVNDLIIDFEKIEAISFCSFLNGVVQSHNPEITKDMGWKEIVNCKLVKNKNPQGIIFHRENLLYLIAQLIKKSNLGWKKITGQPTTKNASDFYKSLLLVNDKAAFSPKKIDAKKAILKNYFIRSHPPEYLSNLIKYIYKMRFQRYWYIYSELIEKLDDSSFKAIKEGINSITQSIGISLKEYFNAITGIFIWFCIIPNERNNNPSNPELKKIGFNPDPKNPKHTETFYITRRGFKDTKFLKLIEHIAIDVEQFKNELGKNRRDPVEGFFRDFQSFFKYPVFKINDDNFCIIDLKFLYEGLCSGFLWLINEVSSENIQNIKSQYGKLLELYFIELLGKIFGKDNIRPETEEGDPDAILETSKHILLFEFTTEYYRIASLYNEEEANFLEDVDKILFNKDKKRKNDSGKFYKLNRYLKKYNDNKKTVIPILVTENYLGDYDLLNDFENHLQNEIENAKLTEVKKHKPLIINLDDLEVFWKRSSSTKAIDQFIEFVTKWQSLKEKGPYQFNFASFIDDFYNPNEVKNTSSEFFNWQEFMNRTK